jgi:hypothetical protein
MARSESTPLSSIPIGSVASIGGRRCLVIERKEPNVTRPYGYSCVVFDNTRESVKYIWARDDPRARNLGKGRIVTRVVLSRPRKRNLADG